MPRTPIEWRTRALLAFLFALSGASSLCFEILWARQLALVIGATSAAIAAVVALFMAGLFLGSLIASRFASRISNPLRAYGLAELAIGLTAAATTLLLPKLTPLSSPTLPLVLLLIVPTTLMGATFPLVTQAWSSKLDRGAGLLYAANTAGASLGCVLVGFVGIGLYGVRACGLTAGTLNCGCGLLALSLARGQSTNRVDFAVEPASGSRQVIAVIAFAIGFAALGEEILWTRALIPYLNSSTYAFATILAVYLIGLALGSALSAQHSAHTPNAARVLVAVQAVLSVVVMLTPRLFDFAESAVTGYVGAGNVDSFASWLPTVGGMFAKVLLGVLIPTLLLGASTPLCIRLAMNTGLGTGQAAGLVSAANTLGGILGAILAGFVLLPRLGVLLGLAALSLVHLLVAITAAVGLSKRTLLLVLTAALLLPFAKPTTKTPFLGRLATSYHAVLVDEGPQDTTAVVEHSTEDGNTFRWILSNGVGYAGDQPASQRYMGLLGDLPVLFSENASSALVICIGTGTTAAAVARYPEVHTLDLVDISPAVKRTLPLFDHVNHRVYLDPRVQIHQADGRRFLAHAHNAYGVITLEPPPPRIAGVGNLYTVEFYRSAQAALRDGGVLAQWLPLHGMTAAEALMLARTFQVVFPDAHVFRVTEDEAILIGKKGDLPIDLERVRTRLEDAAIRQHLGEIGFTSNSGDGLLTEIQSLEMASGPSLRSLIGDGPIVTDDRPLIEQFAAFFHEPDATSAARPRPPAPAGRSRSSNWLDRSGTRPSSR